MSKSPLIILCLILATGAADAMPGSMSGNYEYDTDAAFNSVAPPPDPTAEALLLYLQGTLAVLCFWFDYRCRHTAAGSDSHGPCGTFYISYIWGSVLLTTPLLVGFAIAEWPGFMSVIVLQAITFYRWYRAAV